MVIKEVAKKELYDLYTYRVTWSQEDGEYVGLCAEFPSLSWLADSQEATLQGIHDVVAEVVSDMQSKVLEKIAKQLKGVKPFNKEKLDPLEVAYYLGKYSGRI